MEVSVQVGWKFMCECVCVYWMWCWNSSARANVILSSVSHMNCMVQWNDGEGVTGHWFHNFHPSVPLLLFLHFQNFLCSELWEFNLNILYCTKETQTVDFLLFFNKMKINLIYWSFIIGDYLKITIFNHLPFCLNRSLYMARTDILSFGRMAVLLDLVLFC